MVNELMEHFKEQSVVNFISLLGESQYTARYVFSRFKLDVHRNMARYVLSNSKRFGLLRKPCSCRGLGLALRSREASLKLPLVMNEGCLCRITTKSKVI